MIFVLPTATQAFERRTPVVVAVEKAGPAVVNIRTEQLVRRSSPFGFGFGGSIFDEFFRNYGGQRVYTTQSLGSGMIIDPRGYILTNAHVVEQASRIFVALPGRSKEVEAKLVGMAERVDIAVLKLEEKGSFPALPYGRSDDLLPGETVIAIGNPLGLEFSVTTGVVSATRRRIPLDEEVYSVFIQTDALINPGNSGGPLLNINGELIGVNTAIASQAQGIGFSIPVEIARRIADELISHGRLRPVWLGVEVGHVSDALRRNRGVGGVLVTDVESGSPAATAGLKEADVILQVDGAAVESPAEFGHQLASFVPGDRVPLKVLRGTVEVELRARAAAVPAGYAERYAERTFGLTVEADRDGLLLGKVRRNSPAEEVGLRRGDRLIEVGGEKVATVADFRQAIEKNIGRLPLRFLVARGGRGYIVELQ
jgi:serine protease Do